MSDCSMIQAGEGKDLVFLHGYLASKECFAPQIAYFSRFYRVTAFDFPGFGAGGQLTAPWSVGDYADWTEQTLSRLGISGADVVAHSFGGRVAVKCLSRSKLFEKAVLCGCAGIVPKRTLSYRIKVGGYRLVRKLFPSYAEAHFGSREYRSLSPVMKESYKKIVNEDLRKDAEKIDCPVLLVNGSEDRETPVSSAEVYKQCIRGSRLFVMEGCGHFAFLDQPQTFQLAVEEFLQ